MTLVHVGTVASIRHRRRLTVAGRLADHICRHVPLTDGQKRLLTASAEDRLTTLPRRADLLREGEPARDVTAILDGWACCYAIMADGRRQITGLLLPGDLCESAIARPARADHAVATLTACTLATWPREVFDGLVRGMAVLGEAIGLAARADAAITRQWLVNAGRRTALERAAHLLCELHWRLHARGLAADDEMELPLTQAELADCLGMSAVHVNRTLQELRAGGLITTEGRSYRILDHDGLRRTGAFDPGYLSFG